MIFAGSALGTKPFCLRAERRLRAAETFRLPNFAGVFSIVSLRILYSFL
jgi:hypothetical protein